MSARAATISSVGSLFFHPRGRTDHATCFLFETSCSFQPPPGPLVRVRWEMPSQTGSPKMALYSLTENARSPIHAEPAKWQDDHFPASPHTGSSRRDVLTAIRKHCAVRQYALGSTSPSGQLTRKGALQFQTGRSLVLSWQLVCMVDNQKIERCLGRLELKMELILQGGKQVLSILRVVGNRR